MWIKNNFKFILAKYENWNIHFEINFQNSKYLWKKVSVDLYYWVKVNDYAPVNKYILENKNLLNFICVDNNIISFPINLKKTYNWNMIDIVYLVEFNIADTFLFFDTNKSIPLFIENNTLDYKNLKKDIESYQKDEINKKVIFNNLNGLNKFLYRLFQFWIFYWIIWTIVVLIGLNIPYITYLKYFSFFDYFSYSFHILIISIICFIFLYSFTQYSHISLEFNQNINIINWIEVNKIFTWTIKQNLLDLKIQILLINSEKWAYERWNWTNIRTVYFSEEISNKLIFEKNFWPVYKWTSLEELLSWVTLKLDDIWNNLFNSISISDDNSFWLFTYLEIRVINSEYRDTSIKEIINLENNINFKEEKFNI